MRCKAMVHAGRIEIVVTKPQLFFLERSLKLALHRCRVRLVDSDEEIKRTTL